MANWIYKQTTGEIFLSANPGCIGVGYSGLHEGKNNPDLQDVPNVGPIPQGFYTIGSPFDSPTHGPYCLRLSPDESNEMFGRAGFLMHGDSNEHPGEASEGCIIMPRAVRERVAHGSPRLQVVA